ncbi:MAG: hypothetical protein PVH68_11000 [Armatimonadota bacterium]
MSARPWTPNPIALCVPLLAMAPANAEWLTKYHEEAPWDTTSDPADLDAEVAAGARILQYADGTYVRAIHRQYPQACGPATLAMVLKQLGFARPDEPLRLPANVDHLPGSPGPTVDVGYVGSMEHIMWLGYHRARLIPERGRWNGDDPEFMSPAGDLNSDIGKASVSTLAPDGEMDYLAFADGGRVPNWLWRGKAVGTRGDGNGWEGLPGIMNYIVAGMWRRGCRDARPLTAFSRSDDEVRAFRRIVKGFIDHQTAIVLGMESGGHFNALIGYRGDTEDVEHPFFIYTADPLDGWGRPEARLPGRWRRMNAIGQHMFNGRKLIYQYVCWHQHLEGGCEPGGWAHEVDRKNGNNWLCGRPVPADDPIGDPLVAGERNKARR